MSVSWKNFVLQSPRLPSPQIDLPTDALGPPQGQRLRVAAITTAYFKYSHADDIVTKFIEGYGIVGRVHEPHCDVVGMYVEQQPETDIGRGMAARYEIPLYDNVEACLTQGSGSLNVDAVLLIAEHGDFEVNEKLQKCYPRRRLMEQILDVFRRSGRVAPVFSDKHLAYDWSDAKWIYDQCRELEVPLMAGSSVPVAWRLPPLDFRIGVPLQNALALYYVPEGVADAVDYASYHTLETLQAFVELRGEGETGVRSVQLLEGDDVWSASRSGKWSPRLLEAALKTIPSANQARLDELPECDPNPVVILIEYADGFQAAAYLTRSLFDDEFAFAAEVEGSEELVATRCHMVKPARDHFSFLCNHIEFMFRSGKPSYPVERTLLVNGILDASADSRFNGGSVVETPHLASISYAPPASQE